MKEQLPLEGLDYEDPIPEPQSIPRIEVIMGIILTAALTAFLIALCVIGA